MRNELSYKFAIVLSATLVCLGLGCNSPGNAGGIGGSGRGGAPGTGGSGGNASGGSNGTGGTVASSSAAGGSSAGESSTGGTSTGGTGTGGTAMGGVSASGGRAIGGSATGGTSTGGSSAGGTSTGGSATGGTSTGGTSSGGSSTGGTSTGGNGSGGSATGGSATGGSGTGGVSTGGSGSGGTLSGCNPGAPTPASGGANFPFPQHRIKSYCTHPVACSDAGVTTAWTKYKAKFIVDGGNGTFRVQRPTNSNDTVSEGIAYGMLFTVFMNEKATFDGLWAYAQARFDSKGLMNWQINASGTVMGSDSATDADVDMGFALVMADKQWGGYTTVAKAFLAKVLSNDFLADGTIKGGDMITDINPSYLSPAFYKVFATYTGNNQWNTVVDKSYQTLASAMNATTGLVPDWYSGRSGPNYFYDATRTPFRIGNDYCWNGETRAQGFLQKISAFFGNIGATNIKDGYTVTGSVTGQNNNSSFVGPAGVSGMNGYAPQVQLVAGAYTKVVQDGAAATDDYYNLSWALFTNLMMTGNFINMASP